MNCDFHHDEEAIAVCVNCHKPLCETCRVKLNERNYCSECASATETQDLDGEIKEISNFPRDVAAKADDYLKEKGVLDEVKNLKEIGSEKLKLFSDIIKETTESGIKNVKQSSRSPLDEIKKAKELLAMGAITEEEFEEIKKKKSGKSINLGVFIVRCEVHTNEEAVGFCVECGRGVCEDCAVELDNKNYCKECIEKINSDKSVQKHEYLVCENCGGSYKLQDGESFDDFNACECGGKLKSVWIVETKDKFNIQEIADKIDENKVLKNLIEVKEKIDWIAVLVGTIIVLIPSLLYGYFVSSDINSVYYIFPPLMAGYGSIPLAFISGLIAGYISGRNPKIGKNLKNGMGQGIITGLIATSLGIIAMLWILSLFYSDTVDVFALFNPQQYIYWYIEPPSLLRNLIGAISFFFSFIFSFPYIIITILFGAIGGFTGTFIRIKRSK